jgi:hypothetical protein
MNKKANKFTSRSCLARNRKVTVGVLQSKSKVVSVNILASQIVIVSEIGDVPVSLAALGAALPAAG